MGKGKYRGWERGLKRVVDAWRVNNKERENEGVRETERKGDNMPGDVKVES